MTIEAENYFKKKKTGDWVEFCLDGERLSGKLVKKRGIIKVRLGARSRRPGFSVFAIPRMNLASDNGVNTVS